MILKRTTYVALILIPLLSFGSLGFEGEEKGDGLYKIGLTNNTHQNSAYQRLMKSLKVQKVEQGNL